MKKLVILSFLLSMAAFGLGIKGVSQKGDYCTFKTAPEADDEISYTIKTAPEAAEIPYIISDAECVIEGLDYDIPDSDDDIHYQSYEGEKLDVPMMFFDLSKKANLSKIRRIEFEDGIKIVGSGHTGRLDLGEVTKFNISNNTLRIIENNNKNYED